MVALCSYETVRKLYMLSMWGGCPLCASIGHARRFRLVVLLLSHDQLIRGGCSGEEGGGGGGGGGGGSGVINPRQI